jgi:hypothetical protein
MGAGGYESWFISARDPDISRALWIRHTRHRPRHGPETAALWCTLIDPDLDRPRTVLKQVFAAFPPDVTAGPARFQGHAVMGEQTARWDLAVTGGPPPLRPLRPPFLYRLPLPRTKLEATVPDGQVSGTLDLGGQRVELSRWRGTVGHNWGSEHADSWVWLHAADFGAAPDAWLEVVLARIKVGPARSPWTAMGAFSVGGEPIVLGGLGRLPSVDARPGQLSCDIPSPQARLQLSVTTADDSSVAVPYTDPRGGSRTVHHAALATVELTLRRRGGRELKLTSDRGAYEYGSSQNMPGIVPQPLPDG